MNGTLQPIMKLLFNECMHNCYLSHGTHGFKYVKHLINYLCCVVLFQPTPSPTQIVEARRRTGTLSATFFVQIGAA